MLLAIAMLLSLTSTMVFAEEPEYGVEEPGTTEGDDFDVGFGELVDPIPGATPETAIEIGRVDWSVVAMNYNQTAPVEMTYTTTIPYGATRYFTSQNIAGYELTVGEEEIAATGNPMTGFSFNVTNNNEESEEVVITAKLPLGTMMNPERVTELGMMDVTVPAGAVDGYYYVYNAPAEGTVTLYINSWTVPTTTVETTDEDDVVTEEEVPYTTDMVVTRENGQVLTLSQDGVDNYGLELVLEVAANEQLIIQLVAADDGVDTAYPEASFGWVGSFAYPAGTENNPIIIEWEWNDTYTTATATVTVPAGQTQYFIGNEAMILTANGNPVEQSETGVFTLTEGEYALVMDTPVGAQANPEVIEEMDGYSDTNTVAEGYYYTWTATEDGTVILDVTDGANITVNNNTTYEQFRLAEYAYNDDWTEFLGWTVAENLTIEVKAGDVLVIEVVGYSDVDAWTVPEVTYTLTGAFEPAVVAPEYEVAVSGITLDMASELFIAAKFLFPDELKADKDATLTMEFAGTVTEYNIVDTIAELGVDNRGRLILKRPIPSPYMDKKVTITVTDGNGYTADFTYSGASYENSFSYGIEEYADLAFAQGDAYKTTKDAIVALLTYGSYAQVYFANSVANVSSEPAYNLLTKYGREPIDISQFTLDLIDQVGVDGGDSTMGISVRTGTPALDAAVYMTVQFNAVGLNIEDYDFTLKYHELASGKNFVVDLDEVDEEGNSNVSWDSRGRFVVKIENISAALFDCMYTVEITNKTTGQVYEGQYSIFAYLKAIIAGYEGNASKVNDLNLYKAMYYYNQAANALFE